MTKQLLDDNGNVIPIFVYGTHQSIAYTVASGVIASAISAGIRLVRVWCSTDAYVAIGASATTADMPVTAKVETYFHVKEADTIAAIRITADGVLHVTELK